MSSLSSQAWIIEFAGYGKPATDEKLMNWVVKGFYNEYNMSGKFFDGNGNVERRGLH